MQLQHIRKTTLGRKKRLWRFEVLVLLLVSLLVAPSISPLRGAAHAETARNNQNDTEHQQHRSIQVSGECLTKVEPDRGSIMVSSATTAEHPGKASEKTVQDHNRLKDLVKALRLKDSINETASFHIGEQCTYHKGQKQCEGFQATMTTRFETADINRLGDIIAIASKENVYSVSGLTLTVSPERMQSAREECLITAARNAREKAKKIAYGAGVSVGELISIREAQSPQMYHPMHDSFGGQMRSLAVKSQAAPSIESRPLDVRVEVNARYAIE